VGIYFDSSSTLPFLGVVGLTCFLGSSTLGLATYLAVVFSFRGDLDLLAVFLATCSLGISS
jgi:hypothetical protein